jgi:hypothetical protein
MVGSTDVANWIADASTKNNAKDTMKARLFLQHDFNITYHIVPFQIPILFV